MKQILFFLIDLNIGGTEKSLLNLLHFLPSNYRVTIFVLKKQGGFLGEIPSNVTIKEIENSILINSFIQQSPLTNIKKFIESGDIKKTFIGIYNYIRWKLSGDFTYNFKTIESSIVEIKEQYDIAVAYAGPHDFISYFISNKVKAKKRIQWIHFDISKIGFNKETARNLYRKFDEIKVVSDSVKQELLEVLPEFDKKVKIQHNLVSSSVIKQMSTEKNVFQDSFKGIRVVTVGRLTKEKGHELFIPSMRKLIDEGYKIRWYLVGDGGYKDDLKNKILELKLEEDIVFIGSALNPYTYISQSDIYLQPSYYEGHCVTILEAKILNTPIVCTRFAGALEEINDGINGFVVDVSSEGIYEGVKSLLNDGALCSFFRDNLKNENKTHQNITIEL